MTTVVRWGRLRDAFSFGQFQAMRIMELAQQLTSLVGGDSLAIVISAMLASRVDWSRLGELFQSTAGAVAVSALLPSLSSVLTRMLGRTWFCWMHVLIISALSSDCLSSEWLETIVLAGALAIWTMNAENRSRESSTAGTRTNTSPHLTSKLGGRVVCLSFSQN